MAKIPINEVLAANLAYFMDRKQLSQNSLAARSKVGQSTISLYLKPENRKPGASGKMPSAKLAEVEMLADALGVHVWELLRDLQPGQREIYEQIESIFVTVQKNQQPKAATGPLISHDPDDFSDTDPSGGPSSKQRQPAKHGTRKAA